MRELTGKWFLEKKAFNQFKVKVEVKIKRWSDPSYGHGGGDFVESIQWENAKSQDFSELNIPLG